ncbi:MAG: hypothetical protein KGJ62_15190 [Armatimonadetes bacterium]|nr:hypothetical protein [Armatimonadota bacterium]MDE2206291.1 hypothetical protein [Armatimonadota bacterium]
MESQTLADTTAQALKQFGDPTAINGQGGATALWQRAEAGRINRFIEVQNLQSPAYLVHFPASALAAPWNLNVGSEIDWSGVGVTGVCRALEFHSLSGSVVSVTAVVVLITRE